MFSFKKEQRLKKRAEYDHVFHHGHKIITAAFIAYHLKNKCDKARLGLALSKKAIKHASNRNQMKRFIRESFRYEKLPSVDVVFIARHELLKLNKSDLNASIKSVWQKLKSIYDN